MLPSTHGRAEGIGKSYIVSMGVHHLDRLSVPLGKLPRRHVILLNRLPEVHLRYPHPCPEIRANPTWESIDGWRAHLVSTTWALPLLCHAAIRGGYLPEPADPAEEDPMKAIVQDRYGT